MPPTPGVPDGYHSVNPHLTVANGAAMIDFLKRAFNAVERVRMPRPDGTLLHAEVFIGDSIVMIGEPRGQWTPRPCVLYLYVPDIDAIYKQAVAAGGKPVVEPATMFYGDRHACVRDPAGNDWWIATRVANPTHAEMQAGAAA